MIKKKTFQLLSRIIVDKITVDKTSTVNFVCFYFFSSLKEKTYQGLEHLYHYFHLFINYLLTFCYRLGPMLKFFTC